MHQVFISYSKKQRHEADEIAQEIKSNHNVNVWIDYSGLSAGEVWRREIDEAIKRSSLIIVLVSSDSVNSQYVTYEWAYALGMGRRILPILLEDTALHPRLEEIQYLRKERDDFLEELHKILQNLEYPTAFDARYDDSPAQIGECEGKEIAFKSCIRYAIEDVWGFRPLSDLLVSNNLRITVSDLVKTDIISDIIDLLVDTGTDIIAIKSFYCRRTHVSSYDLMKIKEHFRRISGHDNFRSFILITNADISESDLEALSTTNLPICILTSGVTCGYLISGLSYIKRLISGEIISIEDILFSKRLFFFNL
jgi:TIR domain